MSEPRYVDAEAHAVDTSCDTEGPEATMLRLEGRRIVRVDQRVIDRGHRVLPELLRGTSGAEESGARAHVAMRELVPGAREGGVELFGVLVEALRDLAVGRVLDQREVGRQHHRLMRLLAVVRIGNDLPCAVLRTPLLRAGGALRQFPLVAEEIVEVALRPRDRRRRPRAFEAARDRLAAVAAAHRVLPTEALLFERSAFGLGADVLARIGGAVCLTERMATRDERHRLFVVHRHAAERRRGCPARRAPDRGCRSDLRG
jgi:hypothetical protein